MLGTCPCGVGVCSQRSALASARTGFSGRSSEVRTSDSTCCLRARTSDSACCSHRSICVRTHRIHGAALLLHALLAVPPLHCVTNVADDLCIHLIRNVGVRQKLGDCMRPHIVRIEVRKPCVLQDPAGCPVDVSHGLIEDWTRGSMTRPSLFLRCAPCVVGQDIVFRLSGSDGGTQSYAL
jgi:hypothetical protein